MSEAQPGPGDRATVTVFVEVTPEDAFEVFTAEIDRWWGKGPRFRIGGRKQGQLYFEPGEGGRLFETVELSQGTRTIEVGRITRWQPPTRLSFEWRAVNFKPHEVTFVDITFQAFDDGTQVTVQHHGWSALPDDHPVRHGLTGADFARDIGLWWGALLSSMRQLSESLTRSPGQPPPTP